MTLLSSLESLKISYSLGICKFVFLIKLALSFTSSPFVIMALTVARWEGCSVLAKHG